MFRLNYLMELLTEEAKASLLGIVSRPENYPVLAQRLKEVYGDNRRLRTELQRELRLFQLIAQEAQFFQAWQQMECII